MTVGLQQGNRRDELAATVVLMRMKVVPLERLTAAIEEFGSAVCFLQRLQKESLVTVVDDSSVAEAVREVDQWLERQLDVRAPFDAHYPSNLRGIFNKPPLIFINGNWIEAKDSISVAIVGTRKPTEEGLIRAKRSATILVRAGITVLSGLAKGIDTAAHRAALDAGGRTVAVIGTGIDRIYPKENAGLARHITASGGALISQFFPGQHPTQWSFPMRNVVMSGLSIATLVIEAAETSGARSQARHALEHGRTVFLPRSLVASHEWARTMVHEGHKGVFAVEINSPDEIVDRLYAEPKEPLFALG